MAKQPTPARVSLDEFAAALPGCRFELVDQFLSADQSAAYRSALCLQLPWQQHRIRMFGKELPTPRLSCWVGDAEATYRYSGVSYSPESWTPDLLTLKAHVERQCDSAFNSVLANWYRDGRDSMGWHSDDEPELGPEPCIASISLGARRKFQLRARQQALRCDLWLGDGSLLIMAGRAQHGTQHALPKCAPSSAASVGSRVNLTFRRILLAQPSKPS